MAQPAMYTHPVILRYNEAGRSQNGMKLLDPLTRKPLLDAIDSQMIRFIFLYLYNVRLNRYSLLVLKERDEQQSIRVPEWTNLYTEAAMTGPLMIVQEINFYQMKRQGHTLLQLPEVLIADNMDYMASSVAAMDYYRRGYDMSDIVLYIVRRLRSGNEGFEIDIETFEQFALRRWHKLLLYQALCREAASVPEVVIAPPVAELSRIVRQHHQRNQCLLTPNYDGLLGYFPLIIEFKDKSYQVESGNPHYWHSPYQMQKLVHRFVESLGQLIGTAHVKETIQSSQQQQTTLDILEMDLMEQRREESLIKSRLFALRLAQRFPNYKRPNEEASMKQPRMSDSQRIIERAEQFLALARLHTLVREQEGDLVLAEPDENALIQSLKEFYTDAQVHAK